MKTDRALQVGMLSASVSRNAGGVFEAICGLAKALHRLPAVGVSVFGIADGNTDADLGYWDPVPVTVSPPRGPRSWGYGMGLVEALSGGDLDILHTHGLWMYPSIAGVSWSRRHRKPYIVAPHGMLDPWALHNAGWKKRLAGWLYESGHLRDAACLHALCAAEAGAIRAFGLSNPICVIPNGIATRKTTVRDPTVWQGTVPEGAKVMLYLGRLHPKKGLPALLGGWERVRRRSSHITGDWHLVIVGWDQAGHRGELQAFCRHHEITNSVHFLAPRFGAEKERLLEAADAFVLPSLSEGLPMAVLEAWAHGLAVLMTPQCNLEAGFDAQAALCIDPKAEDIARGLDEIFAMPDRERQAIGSRGRRLVETVFSWPRVAADMYAVYAWVLGGGPRPECVLVA